MRRVFAISLAILVVMLATRGVMAQDSQQDGNDLLLKILKEKNILNDEQLQEIKGQLATERNETQQKLTALDRSLADYLAKAGDATGGNTSYVQNTGVVFNSGDGVWSVFFGGLFQFGYYYEDGDDVDSHGGFTVAENRFDFGGQLFTERLTFYTQLATTWFDDDYFYFGGVDGSVSGFGGDFITLLDAYFDYEIADGVTMRGGLMKVPFGRQALVDKSDLEFGDRSMVNNYFTWGRDVGLMFHDVINFDGEDPNGMALEWAAGIWNGSGGNVSAPYNDTWLSFGGRVAFYPMGLVPYVEGDWEGSDDIRFGIGASVLVDEYRSTGGGDNPSNTSFEVDAVLTWMGIYLTGEFHSWEFDNGSSDMTDTGFFLQGGYFLIPGQLEVLGRFGMITYEDDDESSEWALGGAWYFNGHECKLLGSIGQWMYEPDGGGDDTDNWFIQLGVQIDW